MFRYFRVAALDNGHPMRIALWLTGLFAAAVALALFAGGNEGTVTVFWPPHRVDLSVNLVLLLLLALFALLYVSLRGVAALIELPRQARRWRLQQRERVIQALMLDARAQLLAGRYLRARKAAESVLARVALEADETAGEEGRAGQPALRIVAHLTAAESAHALQDEATRQQHLEAALATSSGAASELREAALLRAAQWALHERDPQGALEHLEALPRGAQRRTATLRLKLKAARQSGHLDQAIDTARLLAKHGAFSPVGARSLMRALASERLDRAGDAEQVAHTWAALDAEERAMPELALHAAEHLLALGGPPAQARAWLMPAWEHMLAEPNAWPDAQRARLAQVLERALAATGDASDPAWLARIEAAQQARPRDVLLQYLAGVACVQRGLWGRAQLLLGQAAAQLEEPALRRNAWRLLAGLAEQRGDEAAALQAWREAAQG